MEEGLFNGRFCLPKLALFGKTLRAVRQGHRHKSGSGTQGATAGKVRDVTTLFAKVEMGSWAVTRGPCLYQEGFFCDGSVTSRRPLHHRSPPLSITTTVLPRTPSLDTSNKHSIQIHKWHHIAAGCTGQSTDSYSTYMPHLQIPKQRQSTTAFEQYDPPSIAGHAHGRMPIGNACFAHPAPRRNVQTNTGEMILSTVTAWRPTLPTYIRPGTVIPVPPWGGKKWRERDLGPRPLVTLGVFYSVRAAQVDGQPEDLT
ncbi:hypothetical protein BDZ97DRAFT_1762596 [Flammula alnicola]|nr:hypothetical protein BDZ97DRAFT_1762596 [Flammula alnicola]